MLSVAIKGAFLSGSMIVAIGSQNAFLLKSGLNNNYVFTVATVCFISDFLLITLGIFGVADLFQSNQYYQAVFAILGAAFLIWYGVNSAMSAIRGTSVIDLSSNKAHCSRSTAIISTLAITFFNPHVYLDTVFIIGSVAAPLTTFEKIWFLSGALFASMLWFFGLSYAASKLIPYFKNKATWRLLDSIISIIMFYIAFELVIWAKTLLD